MNSGKQQKDPKIRMHDRPEDVNRYRQLQNRRMGMDRRSRIVLIIAAAALVMFCLVLIMPGSVITKNGDLIFAQCADQVRSNIAFQFKALVDIETMKVNYSLIKYLAVAAAGAALAVSGAVYQGSFRNALASPTTLGVQSGGVLGGTLYVMFAAEYETEAMRASEYIAKVNQLNFFQQNEQTFSVMLGCFAGVAFVVLVSKLAGRGKLSSLALVLSGSVFGSLISGIVSLVQYYLLLNDPYGARTYEIRFLMLGTFDRILTFRTLAMIVIPVAIGIALMIGARNRINLLVFDEDEARSMGIRVELTRNLLVAVVTVMTAVILSFCGHIGFIGFIVPHVARRFIGTDFRYLIPASALLGAACLILVYFVANFFDYASNINFVTSLVGGLIFLIMIVRFRNRSDADWA